MGGGTRWTSASYETYATTTNYRSASREEVFSRQLKPNLDPRNVRVGGGPRVGQMLRESCDSDINPNATPVILALDVTGSMGAVAVQIAKEELPKLMTGIHDQQVVVDPHIMFMGIDDVFAQGYGALQVSQFEPDIRIVEQLRDMWLVDNGGGNGSESYDLAWYFAGKYTYTDQYEKRGKKGFLFTFGDEPAPFATVSSQNLTTIFGPGNHESVRPEQSLKLAQEMYHVFHIVVERGRQERRVRESWVEMLGNNAIFLRDARYLTEVVLATMSIAQGADMNEVIRASKNPEVLRYAFQTSLNG